MTNASALKKKRSLILAGGKKTEAWKLLYYNDRHAMLRRVGRAFRRFPALRSEFPDLDDAY